MEISDVIPFIWLSASIRTVQHLLNGSGDAFDLSRIRGRHAYCSLRAASLHTRFPSSGLENDVFNNDLLKKMYAPFGANVGRPDWPLWFHDYAFEATCYNTLRCSIIFARHQHALTPHLSSPSGQPHDPDWKKDWYAGFSTGEDFQRHGFPSPVDIRWTALDGVEREIALDLDTVFPERLILHNVPEDEVREDWKASRHLRRVQILLEVNDRTVNVYMRAWVVTKHLQDPGDSNSDERRDLMLAWTQTWPEARGTSAHQPTSE